MKRIFFRMKRGTKIGWVLLALAVLLSIWVLISQNASAKVTEAGVTYEYLEDGSVLITGYTGDRADLSYNDFPEFENLGVKVAIGDYAFSNNDVIETVALPSNITSIGKGAFSNCINLRTIGLSATDIKALPDEVFEGCTNLIGVTSLPDSVVSIGRRAFGDCESLDAFFIGANVDYIQDDAFEGCTSLTNLTADLHNKFFALQKGSAEFTDDGTKLTGFLTPWPGGTMTGSDFTSNCTTIGANAFANAGSNLISLSLPSSVTTIEANAFSNSNIVNLSIPATVTNIGAQTNWPPSGADVVIYGADNSAAKNFYLDLATAGNKVTFSIVGNGDTPTPDPGPTPTPTPTGNLSISGFRAAANANDSTAVDLSWGAVSEATSYIITWTGGGTSGNTTVSASAGTTKTITGLQPNTVYTFSIYAQNASSAGLPATATVTTGAGTTPNPNPNPNPNPYPYSNQTDQPTYYYPYDPYTTDPGVTNNTGDDVLNGGPSANTPDAGGKDSTPKTADGDINPMWFLISGILLAGIALLVYTRMRRLQIISKRDKSDLDS